MVIPLVNNGGLGEHRERSFSPRIRFDKLVGIHLKEPGEMDSLSGTSSDGLDFLSAFQDCPDFLDFLCRNPLMN